MSYVELWRDEQAPELESEQYQQGKAGLHNVLEEPVMSGPAWVAIYLILILIGPPGWLFALLIFLLPLTREEPSKNATNAMESKPSQE